MNSDFYSNMTVTMFVTNVHSLHKLGEALFE